MVNRLLLRITGHAGVWTPVLVAATVADASATLVLPAVLAGAVDAVLTGRPTAGPVLLFAAFVALSAAGEVLTELATGASTARATAWTRRTLLRHILAVGPALRLSPGDLTGRVVSGATDAGIAPAAVVTLVVSVLPPAGAVIALTIIDWRIAAAIAIAMPLIAFLLRSFVRDTSDTVHRYLDVQGRMAGRLADALRGHRTIAAAGTADREADRVLASLPELHADGETMLRTQGHIGAKGMITELLLLVAVLAVAGLELAAGRISVGRFVAAVQYADLATGLGPVIGQLVRLGRARAAVRRAAEVLAHPVPGHGTGELLPGLGHLELRGVSAAGALKEVDLAVSGGKAVAVVGRSGSGKSLLAALAGRLADPDAGEILLDGVPLAGLRKDVLRREVAYAFARPVLFGETVADAVGFGSVRCSRRQIELAAETACADPFIRRLPEGYDTALGDAPMSGGEAQRIGLARAFARPSRLLILDDATSSLDTATELQVSEAVLGRFSDRTRLIVAHRAATAAEADLVIWLEDGRVRGCGTHHVLWLDRDYRAVFGADRP